jgi:peptidoglycan/xylan/chitin deacetylase (PgdA/CDA1 family)
MGDRRSLLLRRAFIRLPHDEGKPAQPPVNTKLLILFAALAATLGPARAAPCGPAALGTSRTISVGGKALAIGAKTYPRTLSLADHEVVLTFDDGPSPSTTSRVLDALAAECAQATFFTIGRNAKAAPDLMRRLLAAGHTLGHHTFSHPARTLRRMTLEAAEADIEHGLAVDDEATYGHYTGAPRVPFFRFPGFADTPLLDAWLAARGIAIFGADFWASDWLPMSADEERQLILHRLDETGGGILLMHDTKLATAAMLPHLLRDLKAGGYRIVHLVPGPDAPALRAMPEGWHSETDAIIAQLAATHPATLAKRQRHRHRGRRRARR